MSLFDRFRKPAAPVQQDQPPASAIVVPPGHLVTTYDFQPISGLHRSNGGVWIASMGCDTDEPRTSLLHLLRAVDDALRKERPKVLETAVHGPISALFAPADPPIRVFAGYILWSLDPATLVIHESSPELLQLLLRQLHTIRQGNPELHQCVHLPETTSPPARFLAETITGLGLPVRRTEAGTILVEVRRPEGVTVSGPTGTLFTPASEPNPYPFEVNLQKDRAQAEGHTTALKELEAQELQELITRSAPLRGNREKPVAFALRLRRLLHATDSKDQAAWLALYQELLGRRIPLLVMVDPKTKAAAQRSWPGRGSALPVYPDTTSLALGAHEMGLPSGSFAVAEMPPRQIFEWMAGQTAAIAIHTTTDQNQSAYVWLDAHEVRALAQGTVPPPNARATKPAGSQAPD